MTVLDDWDQARKLGLLRSSPSSEPLELSGGSGANQRNSGHRDGKVWVAGVVAGPEGDLVAGPTNDNRFVPTADQAVLGKDKVAGLDRGPTFRKVGQDWGAWVVAGFTSRIEGGDDLLVQVFPDWWDHRWASRMDLARRKLGDQIGGRPIPDLDHVEAQLFGGGSSWLSLSMGEPARVRPPITVEAEDDDFP
jgi:hypothetical protein